MKRLLIQTIHPNACYQFNSDFTKTPYEVNAGSVVDDNGSIVMVFSLPSDMYDVKEVSAETKILVVSTDYYRGWESLTPKELEGEIGEDVSGFLEDNIVFIFENGDFRELTEEDFETQVRLKL